MRQKVIGSIIAIILALILLVYGPIGFIVSVFFSMKHIHETEAQLQKPEFYMPAGERLARYCQSDPALFPKYLQAEWVPVELQKLGLPWGGVEPDKAFLEFGGGFYHFGYRLIKGKSEGEQNEWTIFLAREENPNLSLYTFSLKKSDCLSKAEILPMLVASFDRQIAAAPDQEHLIAGKIDACLKYGDRELAVKTCHELLAKMPENWWLNITDALILWEEGSAEKAEAQITAWFKRNPNFFSALDLAYYFQITGNTPKAAEAMVAATQFDASTSWGHGGNADYRAYNAARYAFESGQYDAAIKLCDKLLPVTINGDFAKAGFREIKMAAENAKQGKSSSISESQSVRVFNPYEKLDIDALIVHHSIAPRIKN